MPFIRITTFGANLTPEIIHKLQQGTTDLMTAVMRKPLEGVAVLVEEITQGGWSIAGRPVAVGAHVESTIGLGTNAAAEKSQFMAGMMKLLQAVLGPSLPEATYISFHQFEHDAYGRGGLSRSDRKRREAA